MKRVGWEILKAYIIVTVAETPYLTRRDIDERLEERWRKCIRRLRLSGGIHKKAIGYLLRRLEKQGILVQSPRLFWMVNAPQNFPMRLDPEKEDERMEFYLMGLSDHEIAHRQGLRSGIHKWRKLRGLDPNYSVGGSWRGRPRWRWRLQGQGRFWEGYKKRDSRKAYRNELTRCLDATSLR